MKKLYTVALLSLVFALSQQQVHASDYLSYQETEFEHSGMVWMENFPDSDYEKYMEKVSKRRFFGWRTYTAYKTEPVTYTKETLYVIYNEGETPITENFRFETNRYVKKQYSASGSIGLDASGPYNGFKLGLESKLDSSITTTTMNQEEEEITIKVLVDPNTHLLVQVKGEGKVSNGVAAYYAFWKRIRQGGWEVFIVTTEYYSIVKEVIE